ncbi:hypothetical protein EV182_007195 [Spiromyces aspiralis]|uniref:Uncharacterized protein n=1 Tax=Spiromyces aspiralis TaxID=68401 RepID=A0ACC1HAS5_9FUNG|nr:hypothetical protein EV182_007195 [Spiromyces aspiralis]
MKSLFDTLRSCLPVEPGIRLSKWETLTKELIRQQREEINRLQCSLAVSAAVPATTPSMVGSRPPPTLYPHSSDMLPPG